MCHHKEKSKKVHLKEVPGWGKSPLDLQASKVPV